MVEKQGQKIRAGVSPPLFGQCPKENIFFFREGFPYQTRNMIYNDQVGNDYSDYSGEIINFIVNKQILWYISIVLVILVFSFAF